ncbi:MFS transporter [Cupriavidus taiwanensis]|uniref:Shikimate transporter n=1 Tax=Cupriavidus taiwanensis TaxID=164546 RepID=A0A375C5N2_9BURK|nr:MFS transporter [Cupriavidus taiwanensis]MDK3024093.1 MFS transporter [Cupriavidus taiwanensis]SOY63095.1 Shikimate transporter [Cupriavidus taiwanensis]
MTRQVSAQPPAQAEDSGRKLRKIVTSSTIGAMVEWYDFFLYGVVAGLVFNKLYFPSTDPVVGTLLAYATFAAGFVARPLGGVIFGHFGDTLGRKRMLVLTLMIMGIATTAIGLIPTYDQIGIWAPVLLLLCRIAQGIGLGGEWGGAVLMTFESAPAGRRGFFASLPQTGMSLGLVLASGVIALLSLALSDQDFLAWGWRIAFLLSAVMVFIGSYMRTHVEESPEFAAARRNSPRNQPDAQGLPFLAMLRQYPRVVLACMGARFIDGVFFNVFGVYSLSYLTQTLKLSRNEALLGVLLGAGVMTLFIPLWGAVSDRVGRPLVYGTGALLAGLSAFPAFWLMQHSGGNVLLVWAAIIIPFGIFHAAVFGTMSSMFSEVFDARVRYTGISFVYQFAGVFAGGLTPIIATWLNARGAGEPWYLCGYVLAIGVLSAACTLWIGRRSAPAGAHALAPSKAGA